MFDPTFYSVDPQLVIEASKSIPNFDFRIAFNEPTGSFFYDPWVIKNEFKNTVWEELLNSLPEPIGEARIIKLDPGTCYRSHSDIDDRWHLSIISEKSYIVTLDDEKLYPQTVDYRWHFLDAGSSHSAVNFGNKPRVQIVVRKLLEKGTSIKDAVTVSITLKKVVDDRRYIFDEVVSPWLNSNSKRGMISNFQYENLEARFTTDSSLVDSLRNLISDHFNLTIVE
jgi:hypothetical protein